MARCTSVKAGPATSCLLPLPSPWPPGIQTCHWDPPSPFALCPRRTSGKALALRAIRPFSLSPPHLLDRAHCLAEISPCGLLMPPVTVSLGPVSIENFVFLGLSHVPSCSCFWQHIRGYMSTRNLSLFENYLVCWTHKILSDFLIVYPKWLQFRIR